MNKQKEKTFTLPGDSNVTQALVNHLDNLISFSSPSAFRKSILEVYQQYIISQHEILPSDFESIACDFYILIDFLTKAEEEIYGYYVE